MSSYRHDARKFADAGLQLRLPVDLVPAMQYSRLTNVLPVIEGELRARTGLTFVADIWKSSLVSNLQRVSINTTDVTMFYSPLAPGNAGYFIGEQVTITILANVLNSGVTFPLGSFTVTITGSAPLFLAQTGYTFTPPITGTVWPGTTGQAGVFAQAQGSGALTTLPSTIITNIYRLTQSVSSFTGDRIVVMAGRMFRASLPDGNSFTEIVRTSIGNLAPTQGNGLSGGPISIVGFRFTNDTASWAIIADRNIMLRYRENPNGANGAVYFYLLGKPAPQNAAVPVDGGAGLLNSTGGTGFDWRYTWHDSVVNTEGNPSPITTGPPDTKRPTSFTNPDPADKSQGPPDRIFVSGISSPSNAFDGSATSFATAAGSQVSRFNDFPPFTETSDTFIQSCIFRGIANPASPPSADVFLNIVYDAATAGSNGLAQGTIDLSVDGGATYKSLVQATGNVAQTTLTTTLDTTVDYTNIRIRMKAQGLSSNPGGDAVTMALRIYDINITTASTSGALVLVNKKAQVTVDNPVNINDGRITGIRLYRRGGSLTDAWRLVGTFALAGLATDPTGLYLLTDNVPDATLEVQPIMQLDNDMPVTSVDAKAQPLTFIWGPVGLEARLLGCGDPSRPEVVYFSKPGNPDAWPPQNYVEVCEPGTPVIAGCVYNTRTYAFSREGCYELVEGLGTGTTFAPFKTPSAHGLYAAQALAIGPAIYFVAKDGVYQSTGGQEESLVENNLKPLFATYDGPGQDVEGYEAVDMTRADDMRLRYHNDELYFCYIGATTGTRQMMIYDILKKRWRSARYTNGISEVYSEPATISSLLMGTAGGAIYQAGGSSDPNELDTVETVSLTSSFVTGTVTLTSGSYFARVTRLTALGEVGMSNEVRGLVVDSTHGIGFNITAQAPADTTGWRVYFGLVSGQENQYQQFPPQPITLGQANVIRVAGTAGTVPTASPNSLIQCVLRTGAHDQGAPLNQKQYGNVIFDLDPGGADAAHPVTITPYVNGEIQAKAAQIITGTGRQQVPLNLSDYFAFNTEYEVSWSRALNSSGVISDPVLFQYDTLTFMEPVAVTHWESQPTSFEFPGFIHCRDAYIAIRSTTAATLKMTFDTGQGEVVQTYTVPSTSGLRAKVYVQFASNKGLAYRFALDSAASFRLYEEDIEFRVKPWLGLLGYGIQRVMGGEVNA